MGFLFAQRKPNKKLFHLRLLGDLGNLVSLDDLDNLAFHRGLGILGDLGNLGNPVPLGDLDSLVFL